MPALPEGTLTFFLTDIQGSTALWDRRPDAMGDLVARHDALLSSAIQRHGGHVVRSRGEGDSCFAVFSNASDATAAAVSAQQALENEPWPPDCRIRVRAAVLTGEAHLREDNYYGSDINRAARVRALGSGGQTLLSESTYVLVRDNLPPDVAVRDLGRHRLRDLLRPEHIFELVVPGVSGDRVPLRSVDALPNNLPLQLTSFVGRDEELRELQDLLAANRLVTITGAGGSGKTRLAIHVAAELIERYRDGVWLAELGPLNQQGLAAQTVALSLGLQPDAARSALESLTEHLSDREVLLLMDNCEHLVEDAARITASLLQTCRGVRIVATSREPLRVAGEQVWRIPSLGLPSGAALPRSRRDLPQALAASPAVQLFLDRAASVRPGLSLTPENAAWIAEICRQLDGIPLAIELAAARTRVLSVEQIAQRLTDRFRLLTGGNRTALPRHQTLRALIDWSYDLLSEPEQALLRRLSPFAGAWTLEAAEAVGGGDGIDAAEVLELAAQLMDRSLLVAEFDPHGHALYRLLYTIRDYARERLDASAEAKCVRARYVAYYVEEAKQAEIKLVSVEQAAWLLRLDRDLDNVRSALEWAFGPGELPEHGLQIAVCLFRFWFSRGYLSEGRLWLERGLSMACDANLRLLRARALSCLGSLASAQGDQERAGSALSESLELCRTLGDRRGVATALNNLGMRSASLGALDEARRHYEESSSLYAEIGDERRHASALANLGLVLLEQWDLDAAEPVLRDAIRLNDRAGDAAVAWVARGNLGRLLASRGRCHEAIPMLQSCLRFWHQCRDRHCVPRALLLLAEALHEAGHNARVPLLVAAANRERLATGDDWSAEEHRIFEAVALAAPASKGLLAEGSRSATLPPLDDVVGIAMEEVIPPAAGE
jgi:predicted ATPase/class 3 adenylate cyclase